MGPRLQQNFRGSRALIMAADGGAVDILGDFLLKLDISVARARFVDGATNFDFSSLRSETDILFVDGDLDLSCVSQKIPDAPRLMPVIGLVGVEAPGRLRALMNLGATAFIRKPVHVGAIYTALFLGINAFNKRRDLELQLEDHQSRRKRRREVVKAIVLLMHASDIDDDEAYARLRRESMRMRLSLEDYCEEYVRVRSAPTVESSSSRPCVAEERGSS